MTARLGMYSTWQVVKQKKFLILLLSVKNTLVVVNFFAQKNLGMQFQENVFQSSQELVQWKEG